MVHYAIDVIFNIHLYVHNVMCFSIYCMICVKTRGYCNVSRRDRNGEVTSFSHYPNSKVQGANMGSIWGRQDPGGAHVDPMNFAIWSHTSAAAMVACSSIASLYQRQQQPIEATCARIFVGKQHGKIPYYIQRNTNLTLNREFSFMLF